MSDHEDEMRDLVRALFRRDDTDPTDDGETDPPDDTDNNIDPDRAMTRLLFNNH